MLVASTPGGPPVVEGVRHRIGTGWRGGCRDLFQLQFQNESIFIHFPYQPDAEGIVNRVELPVGREHTFNVTDSAYGMTCKIKYHHPIDGRAHFSQDGGIRTVVKNQADRLDSSVGHFFTLELSGISSFRPCKTSSKVPDCQFSFDSETPVDPLHVYGHWIKLREDQEPGKLTNPVNVESKDNSQKAIAVAPPKNSPLYPGIVAIFARPGLRNLVVNPGDFRLMFLGGFAEGLNDDSVPSSFMAMMYPADISGLGLIDFVSDQ